MKKKTIAVLAIWRDNEETLPRSLKQLESLEKKFTKRYDFFYSFYENDSKDNTLYILRKWLKARKGFIKGEKLNRRKYNYEKSINRTEYLAAYRNKCLSNLKEINHEFLLIVDSEIIFSDSEVQQMIYSLITFEDFGMITPNTVQNVHDHLEYNHKETYFDSWALIDQQNNGGLTFAANPFLTHLDRNKWDNFEPVFVKSAFGGLALVRSSIIKTGNFRWNGKNGCEHWSLGNFINNSGYKVVVDRKIKTQIKHDHEIIPDTFQLLRDKIRLKNSTTSKKDIFQKVKVLISLLFINIINFLN